MLHSACRRAFISIIFVLLIASLLPPSSAFTDPIRNATSHVLTPKFSVPSSSVMKSLDFSINIFGIKYTVTNITAEKSEQIEFLSEHAECTSNLDPVACANFILSATQMRTGGLFSELIRLTKVAGNAFICLGPVPDKEAACLSLTQEVLRELFFGPPPISNGTPPPSGPTHITGIEPFVGTWGVGGISILTINADGSASYQARDVRALIQFTQVQGNTLYGTVTNGTVMPIALQGNPIQSGGNITVTLTDPHDVQVSNGDLLCQPTDQCAY